MKKKFSYKLFALSYSVTFVIVFGELLYALVSDENSDIKNTFFESLDFIIAPVVFLIPLIPFSNELIVYIVSVLLITFLYTSMVYLILGFLKEAKQNSSSINKSNNI
ncbi:hypothetical protein [Chryseobacterium caseinilyticum]|uniref:Uncharacterized protein n=1 Tax=Chryseobacterium caseinilyticum TaxID=2771428 RepID=A0ABR8Z6R4_9FLAO|nr:hypothetical protein [Chryseobacterium caseinilyticum]MBD8080962.1 hypothetical protein [Chryseobacterium caseinilyticum]